MTDIFYRDATKEEYLTWLVGHITYHGEPNIYWPRKFSDYLYIQPSAPNAAVAPSSAPQGAVQVLQYSVDLKIFSYVPAFLIVPAGMRVKGLPRWGSLLYMDDFRAESEQNPPLVPFFSDCEFKSCVDNYDAVVAHAKKPMRYFSHNFSVCYRDRTVNEPVYIWPDGCFYNEQMDE